MKVVMRLVVLGAFLVCGAPPALAQDESGVFLEVLGGSFQLDGSCVLWADGECLEGLPEGGDDAFIGVRFGYRSADRWSVEATYARDAVGESVVPPGQDPSDPREPTRPPETLSEPIDVRLWTVGGTYSLVRRSVLDLYASAGVGRITFDQNGSPDRPMRDLVTVVGGGALVHVWRIVFLRGDLRGYTQWCNEDGDQDGFACDDGSILGHLEASVGVQLVFHPYDW